MAKSPDAFRTISEVADWLGVQAHVLRFWESKFQQVKPVKRAGGRRYYRPSDMKLLGGIKKLLHDDGLTIKGVQKILRENGQAHVAAFSPPLADPEATLDAPSTPARPQEPAKDVEDRSEETVISFHGRRAQEAAKPRTSSGQMGLDLFPPETAASGPGDEPGDSDAGENTGEDSHEKGALPSFLHAPGATGADTPPAESVAAGVTAPEMETKLRSAKARVVDAPDPPPDDHISSAPGPLSQLLGASSFDGADILQITECANGLRAWLDRYQDARTG